MKLNKKGITIVELIVVITILAILWTVWFLSFQSYNIYSRDVKRLTDIKNIKSVLEYTYTESWLYPTPDWENNITFSWSTAWIQWTFWNKTKRKTKRLSNVPLDPLTQNQYSYSVTVNKNEFEIWGVFEWDEIVSNNLIKESYADEFNFKAYISWNYNGKIVKVKAWTINYILSAPSIILNDYSFLRLEDIIEQTNSKFVINWNKVMPESYWIPNSDIASSDFIKKDNFVVFSWSLDDLSKDEIEQENFINNLILAYSWTVLETKSWIKEVINSTSSNKLFLSQTILKNSIDESIKVTANNGSSNTEDSVSCSDMIEEQATNLNTFFNWTGYNWDASYWCGLTTIDASNSWLSWSIPTEIWYLTNLVTLTLNDNSLDNIPSEIGNLSSIETLTLYRNDFTSVPSEIGNLSTLKSLQLSYNDITSLPSTIWDLDNLEYLYLYYNKLTSLPTEIWDMDSLLYLYAYGNRDSYWNWTLTSIPSSIWNISTLQKLFIENNGLTSIPTSISNLNNLTYLKIHQNELTSIPSEIFGMDKLTYFYAGDNNLTSIPSEIGDSVIRYLYLQNNNLSSFEERISELNSLYYLYLSWNPSLWNLSHDFTKDSSLLSEWNIWIYWNWTHVKIDL